MLTALCLSTASAETLPTWHIVAAEDVKVPLSHVVCLLAADDAETFSIVRDDADAVSGLTSVTFERIVETGVHNSSLPGAVPFATYAHSTLTVTGASGAALTVTAMDGTRCIATKAESDSHKIDVSALAPGTYVLAIGKTSVKFIKR